MGILCKERGITRLRIVFTTTLSYGWVASKLSAAAPPEEPVRRSLVASFLWGPLSRTLVSTVQSQAKDVGLLGQAPNVVYSYSTSLLWLRQLLPELRETGKLLEAVFS